MASSETIPPKIAAILVKSKEKKLTKKQKTELAYWIIDMRKSSDFNLKRLVIDSFGYSEQDYNTLWVIVDRFEKGLTVSAKEKLKKLEGEAFSTFITDIWKEAKSIATDTLQRWYRRAVEFGYFDKENETVRMKEFVEDACNFYVNNKETIGSYEEEILNLKAAVSTFAEISKPNVLRIMALHSYIEFTSLCTLLAARGIPVPEAIIIEVKNTVNRVILSTHPAMRERIEA
ncbi:hypothetical protein ES703_19536 [subsurface metagenome]